MKLRSIHLVAIIGIFCLSGLVHGTWTNRWAEKQDAAGVDMLSRIEGRFADWKAGDAIPIPANEIPAKTTVFSRQFISANHQRTTIQVSIAQGPPGIVSVHTPEVCYPGNGYRLKTSLSRVAIPLEGGKNAEAYTADFEKSGPNGSEVLRVYWCWTEEGDWQAPEYPRLKFMCAPILYKCYIVYTVKEDDALTKDDPYRTFTGLLLPALTRQLQSR